MKHHIGHSVHIGIAFGYDVGKISAGCLVTICATLVNSQTHTHRQTDRQTTF